VLGAVENVLGRAASTCCSTTWRPRGRSGFFDVMPVRKRVDAIVFASLVLSDAEADALHA